MAFPRQTSPQGTLLAVSTMKDEGPYVLEWVAHHLAAGFTDVLVYTNDCTDGTDTMLQRLQALGVGVQHRTNAVPEGVKPQPAMLKLAADEPMLADADWVLILDADEFLCVNHPSGLVGGIVADLNAVQAQAMVLTWRVFGSNGVQDWSPQPVTDQFTRAAPEFWNKGWGTKTLFRYDPKYLRPGIHRPIIKAQHKDSGYAESVLWVNGSGKPLDTWFKLRGWRSIRRTLGYDWGQVNHYAIKSMDAYALRKLRGNVNLKADKYNFDYWALQDRNEEEDLRIARHRDLRDKILGWFLQDPDLRRLHSAAIAGVMARLADHRSTDAYAALVEGLTTASRVPISDVVAKPPKPRDRTAIASLNATLEKRKAAKLAETSGEGDRFPPLPGGGSALAQPYVSGPVAQVDPASIDVVDNIGLKLPLDQGIFTPSALNLLRAGKFDRRNARNIGALLKDCTRLLDLDCGFGFVGLRARLSNPALQVTLHDERPALHLFSQRVVALNFPDASGIHRSQTTLNADGLWGGLAGLIAASMPDALRLSDANLPAEAFPLARLDNLRRVLIPVLDPAACQSARARLGPPLVAAGFAEDTAGEAAGTLLFCRS